MIAVSDRGLLVTCTTISVLSFVGILFLVIVMSMVVSKAVALSIQYEKFKTQASEKVQNLVESDEFKEFQDHLVDAGRNFVNTTKRIVIQHDPVDEENSSN